MYYFQYCFFEEEEEEGEERERREREEREVEERIEFKRVENNFIKGIFVLFIMKERNFLILIDGNLEIYKFNVYVLMNVFLLNSCLVGLEEKRSNMQSLLFCWRV